MSETPFMQFWTGDFLGDTLHLTPKEVGQYVLLLMAMWRNGGVLPDDPKKIARIARGVVSDAVMAYFDTDQEGIYQKRLRSEYEKAMKKHSVRVACGKAGVEAKALKNNNPSLAKAQAMLKHSSEPESEEEAKASSMGAKRATTKRRLPPDFQPRSEDVQTLLSEGFSLSEIEAQLVRFRDHYTGTGKPMIDWYATFRNWVRRSAEMNRGQGPPGSRRDGMRIALDKLGGKQHGAGLGTLSEFLALSGDRAGSEGIAGAEGDEGTSDYGGEANTLSISKGEQPNRC